VDRGEARADIGVDIAHAVFRRHVDEIAEPIYPAGRVKLLCRQRGVAVAALAGVGPQVDKLLKRRIVFEEIMSWSESLPACWSSSSASAASASLTVKIGP
jgi:hypothetical protein